MTTYSGTIAELTMGVSQSLGNLCGRTYSGVLLQPVSSSGGGSTTWYTMRAWWSGGPGYWYWSVASAPDMTGASSGKTPADLSFILVSKIYTV